MSTINTSIGRGFVPRTPPQVAVDVVGGTIINYTGSGIVGGVISGYALSGGSTHVGGLWPMQAGFWSGTTDGTGQASITFPYAFKNTPASVVATVEGSDYVVRIVSRATTGFTAKVLQVGVNWTSGAVLGSGLNISTGTAVTSVSDTTANNIVDATGVSAGYVSTSGGSFVSNGTQYGVLSLPAGLTTAVTSVSSATGSFTTGVTTNSGVAVVSVSGFLTAAASVSVTIDWFAAA